MVRRECNKCGKTGLNVGAPCGGHYGAPCDGRIARVDDGCRSVLISPLTGIASLLRSGWGVCVWGGDPYRECDGQITHGIGPETAAAWPSAGEALAAARKLFAGMDPAKIDVRVLASGRCVDGDLGSIQIEA